MTKTTLLAAGLGFLFATSVALDADAQSQTKRSSQTTADSSMMEKDQDPKLGHKTWKERINTVARKPLHHDIDWLDSRDRTDWDGHQVWQGIRDARPMIARKTTGFHEPRPHVTRRERVLTISRGPIQGPGPAN